VRLLEDNLIHNLKRRRHGDECNLVVQKCCDNGCIWTLAPYKPQGILVRLDAFQLAFPHGLCSYRHHRLVFKPKTVAHCHFDQLTLKHLVHHPDVILQLGKLPKRAALTWDFVRLCGTSMHSLVIPARADSSMARVADTMKSSVAS
jgi:hypothetical protein